MIGFQGPLRLVAGVLGLTGVSSAVATPIIFYVKSDSLTDQAEGGGNKGVALASITKCTNPLPQESLKTQFGASNVSTVCWKGENITDESKFNEFFKTKWGDSNTGWRDTKGQAGWVQQCQSSTPWVIWDTNSETENVQADKEELLGLCDSFKTADQTLFVKKKQQSGTITLSICESQCWENANVQNSINVRNLQSHQEDRFKTIDFYQQIDSSA